MNEWFLLYLFTRLDHVLDFARFLDFLCLAGFVICCFALFVIGAEDLDTKYSNSFKRLLKLFVFLGLFFGVVTITIPTQKETALIVGSKIAFDAVRSPEAAQIGGKVKELVLQKLDSEIAALKQPKVEQ